MATRALVISDTHISAETLDKVPEAVWNAARQADVILHAGDVMCRELLDRLAEFAPVHAVLGNNDVGRIDGLPETAELELDGVRVAMIHDSGARKGREARMHRRFHEADVVVFGHSHAPVNLTAETGQLLFNPGSPTQRRRQPNCSYGVLELASGSATAQVVLLPTA